VWNGLDNEHMQASISRAEWKPEIIDYDLTAERKFLFRFAKALVEAAFSPDPLVVHAGLTLVRSQRKDCRR
jgi:hypothetical protein